MTRRGRLFFPLFLGAVTTSLYYFVHTHPTWTAHFSKTPAAVENVILFVAALPLILFLTRALDMLVFDVFASRRKTIARAPLLLRELVSIVLFAVLLAWVLSALFHYRVTAFLATGTVLAAVLGLALQETLGNLFAGIALHLEDSFEVGDVVRTGDFYGVVEAVRWRGTRLRTFNNDIVIVPNSMLARERMEIFPRGNVNGRVLSVGLDYNVPPADVIAVLTQAAAHVPGVVQVPPAIARLAGFSDSTLQYEVKYFMHDYSHRDRIDADIRKAIWYALRRNGIPMAFPIRAYQRYQPPAPPAQPSLAEIVERLDGVQLLAPLSADERATIAGAARIHVYSSGEAILKEGAAGNSMFTVYRGTVSVRADGQEIAQLHAGDVFGEMALLTGAARAADVVAAGDVVAIEITKDALHPVLAEHPELATSLSAKVSERRGSLDSARSVEGSDSQHSVLSRIRDWFGL
jgi:small-conductance mechanosensitive channel/CRP-like cAMP-binding protein